MKNTNYIKYCSNCIIPETRPNTEIDSSGLCTGCKYYIYRSKIDWTQRHDELIKIIDVYKSKFKNNYDCIVPSSGGKDSTYQVLKVLELGLKPLVVTIMPDMLTPIGRKNIDNIKNFGVDCIEFSTNKILRKKINKFTLETVGDLTWAEEVSISCETVRIANKMKIPLVVWGENSENENGGPEKNSDFFDNIVQAHNHEWFEEFGGTNGLRSSDLLSIWSDDGITEADLLPYTFPSKKELLESNVHGIFLGYYIPWDGHKNAETAKNNGLIVYDKAVEGNIVDYENLDNYQMRIHDYFKFLKYGYDRVSDWSSLGIRRGRLNRDKAIELSREVGGKYPKTYLGKNIKEILGYIDINEDEFQNICEKFTNKKIFKKNSDGTLLYDNSGDLIKINYDNPK
tara:strand:+ start:11052 stop:12245 length:1194 start_codon:yes stop_codon:yes gene_type:complete